VILTNAHGLTAAVEELGYTATTIPSVIHLTPCRVESSRERVLFVNLVAIQGLDTAVELAAARPDVPFAFVEWWKLPADEMAALRARVASLPNVEIRPSSEPGRLYADTRVLLAPFRFNGRSRLVLEAQCNGIPVLGTDLSAVAESIGPGGVVVPLDAPIERWAAALGEIVDDPARYAVYCDAAREHAGRDEVDPERIVDRFEGVLADLVGSAAGGAPA
jgi:glycosyltransferase involved in cell wall biosynthesis